MKKVWFYTLFLFILFIGFDLDKVKAFSSGTYKIVSALDESKVLTSADDGNIQINTNEDKDNQLWDVVLQNDGSYIITSKVSKNQSFDVADGISANGTNIRLYYTNKTKAQKWNFKSSGDGFYYVQSKLNSSKVLDIQKANIEEDTNVQLYYLNYTNAQKFKFVPVFSKDKVIEDGTYIIKSYLNNEKVVSLEKEASDGVNVNLTQGKSSYINAFNFKYIDNGYYEISPYGYDDMVLNVIGDKGYNGLNVQITKKTNSTNKWIIKDNFDGSYSFVSSLDYYYMDVSGAKTYDGTNIQLYNDNGHNAQKFNLTKIEFPNIEDDFYTISLFSNDKLNLSLNNKVVVSDSNIELKTKNDENNQKWKLQNIKENIYEIKSALDESYVFDVNSGSLLDKANVRTWKTNSTDAQRWHIIKLDDGSYRFTNVKSGKNLDVANANFLSGSNIWQYKNNDTSAQKFNINKTKITEEKQIIENDNYMVYTALNLNKSLNCGSNVFINDISSNSREIISTEYIKDGFYVLKNNNKAITNNNGKIIMNDYKGNDNQLWYAIKNGNYYTFISKYDGKVLDVINGSSANNTRLQTYYSNNTNAQKFYLEAVTNKKIDDGYYAILSNDNFLSINGKIPYNGTSIFIKKDSDNSNKWYIKNVGNNLYEIRCGLNLNKVLDVKNGSVFEGNDVQLYSRNSTPAQRWYIISLKDGSYKFISAKSHTNLTVSNDKIKIYSNNLKEQQKFKIIPSDAVSYGKVIEDGYYTINSALNSKKVLDVASGNIAAGTNVQLYSLNNTLAQIWKFKYLENGVYKITSALNPKRVLTNANGNVVIGKDNDSDNQRWYVQGLENNNFSLISAKDGLYIDVALGKTTDKTNIGVYPSNDTSAQKFDLKEYKNTKTYRGIDISKWQGNIDWKLLVRENPQFIIMRVGRGLGDLGKDVKFEEYYKNATNYDIPVGVYIYGFATNLTEAKKEAEYVIKWLDGKNLDLPVFYDIEYSGLLYLGKDMLTSISETFCDSIMANNYHCGVYANIYWLTNFLDGKHISNKYPIWLAHWTGANDYNSAALDKFQSSYKLSPYKYWQFSSLGKYPGITENTVDLDFGYDIFD